MGKVRVKTIGGQEELEEKEKRSVKRAEKKAREEAKEKVHLPGMGGGQRVKVVGPTEEEIEKVEEVKQEEPQKEAKAKKKKFQKVRERSQKYKDAKAKVEAKNYSLSGALKLLKDTHLAKFDETVEIHINTLSGGISGSVALPHGSGRQTKVAVATDALITDVEKGKVDFDILIATPEAMPKLARVAKVLGPRGLMPSPKSGTITDKPEALVEKFKKGQVNYKTEAKAPIIHMAVGKLSFGDEKLKENIEVAISAIKRGNIRDITLKSTMSPGIKLEV